jgi:hypothetical protein
MNIGNPKLRQFFVNCILFWWHIAPLRLRVWAFLNDGDIQDLRNGDERQLHND